MTAHLIPPGAPEFRTRFATFSYSVFRLETLQSYGNSGEDAAFLADEPAPHEPAVEEWDAPTPTRRRRRHWRVSVGQ